MTTNEKIKAVVEETVNSLGDIWVKELEGDATVSGCPKFVRINRQLKEKLQHRLEALVREERGEGDIRACEILSKYALKTNDTEALDLIESAQKEILSTSPIANNKN